MLLKFVKLRIPTLALATKVLLLSLFALSACGKESYYLGEGNSSTLETTVEPFLIWMQPSLVDRRSLRIGIFLNPYSRKGAEGGVIEIACKDIAVLGDGKSLRRLRATCPSGEALLQQKIVEVVFDLPDGPPSKIVVTMPKITVKKSGSQSEEIVEKRLASFIRKDWVRKPLEVR